MDSITHGPLDKGPHGRFKTENKRRNLRQPKDAGLTFQEGVPLQEEDKQKICSTNHEIFMAIISEIDEHDDDLMG